MSFSKPFFFLCELWKLLSFYLSHFFAGVQIEGILDSCLRMTIIVIFQVEHRRLCYSAIPT